MRHVQWLLRLVGVAALALPLASTAWAQDTSSSQGSTSGETQAERQQDRQERREKIKQRLRELEQQVKTGREALKQAINQYGKDSPQARAARQRLRQDTARLKQARKHVHDRMERRRDRDDRPAAQSLRAAGRYADRSRDRRHDSSRGHRRGDRSRA